MDGILDYVNIKPNNELNSKLFTNEKIHYKIVQQLKKIADEFIDYSKIKKFKVPIKDIFVTGSIINYNYSDYSDIDIHILVDISKFKGRNKEIATEYFNTKKMFWNLEHDIKVLGYDVELSIQPTDQEHHATAIYSILKNEFIKKPKKQKYKVNKNKIYSFYKEIKEKIDNVTCENVDKVRTEVKKLRKTGLNRKNYEYSEQNLVFKILRNKGILDKLSKFKSDCVTDKLSYK